MKNIMSFFIILLFLIPSISYANNFPSKSDVYWLTQNIYHESRGESIYGQIMIGIVTLERLNSGRWGNDIRSVVTAPSQFSWYSKGKSIVPNNKKSWDGSKVIAKLSLMIYDNIKNSKIMYYHNNNVHPKWAKKMYKIITIGNHTFYKEKGV